MISSDPDGPIAVALRTLKKTVAGYVLFGEFVTFIGLVVLVVAQLMPVWPYAAVLIIACLFLLVVTLFITLAIVIFSDERHVAKLNLDLQHKNDELGKRVERRILVEAQLKNKFGRITNECKNMSDLLESLQRDVFPFLVKDFSFSRVALLSIEVSKDGNPNLIFKESYLQKNLDDRDRIDLHVATLSANKAEAAVEEVSYGDKFVVCYFPVFAKSENMCYVFAFHIEGSEQSETVKQEHDFLEASLAGDFKKVIERVTSPDGPSPTPINHKRLCAILYRQSSGQVYFENETDFSKEELLFFSSKLKDEKNNACLSQAFRRDLSHAEESITISQGSCSLTFIPIFVNDQVYRVITILDELNGQNIATDGGNWKNLSSLVNYLYCSVEKDDLTGLVNKWVFERHLKQVFLSLSSQAMVALFAIGAKDCQILDILEKNSRNTLSDIAAILGQWTKGGPSQSLVARYEGGIFLLVRQVPDIGHATAIAVGIKDQITKTYQLGKNSTPIFIGVTIIQNKSIENGISIAKDPQFYIGNSFAALKNAEKNRTGIFVASEQVSV